MQRQVPEDDPIGHLTSPIVTGGAIIALKCREGVIIATDTLLSYGGLLSIHPSTQSIMASTATKSFPTS
jgi:20S proteasome alpha/beta subunit